MKRHFWNWFIRYQNEYRTLDKKSKKEAAYWLYELKAHLRAYGRCFSFTLALPGKLTITVNGKAKHFKRVETFVALAPSIPGWTIQALEEPQPIDFLLHKEMAAAGIHPSEFRFSFLSDDSDIIIYHPLCTESNRHLFLPLAYGAVYNLLGERSFGTELRYLQVKNLSSAGRVATYALDDLPVMFGQRRSQMVVDSNGVLWNGE